jgi:hypothetical protein
MLKHEDNTNCNPLQFDSSEWGANSKSPKTGSVTSRYTNVDPLWLQSVVH